MSIKKINIANIVNFVNIDISLIIIKRNKLKNKPNENKSKSLQTHPQAIYTSRLLNFKNLPEPVNSTDYGI